MGMNPDTNKFEMLMSDEHKKALEKFRDSIPRVDPSKVFPDMASVLTEGKSKLFRPDGSPVPDHWATYKVGEEIVIKNYTFKVAYIGETAILFEPVGPVIIGDKP